MEKTNNNSYMEEFFRKIRSAIIFIYATNIIYLIDVFLSISFVISILYILFVASDKKDINTWVISVSSLLTTIYALFHHFNNRIIRFSEIDSLKNDLRPYFENCQLILEKHLNMKNENILNAIEEATTNSLLQDYLISKNVYTFELKIIKSYISFVRSSLHLEMYIVQFLEYRIITSAYNHLYSRYSQDYSSFGNLNSTTQNYKFGQLLYGLAKNSNLKLDEPLEEPPEVEIVQALTEAFQTSNNKIKALLKDEQNRQELDFLLGKVFENAYTNTDNLMQNLDKNNEEKKNTFLFKYDERFYAPRKVWKDKIQEEANNKYSKEEEKKKFIEEETKKLSEIIDRQPFSKSLAYYKSCVRQIGRDYFAYILVPAKFPPENRGWSVEKFITKKIIPKAREFQKELNKEILKKMPYLKGTLKRKLDANYYIIYFNNSDFRVFAEAKTIPKAFKNIIVKTIIESEDADNKILSQIIYIKQVINSLSLSGLLFSEDQNVQDLYLKHETKIIKEANKEGIHLRDINQIASLGNQSLKLAEISYKIIYKKESVPKRSPNFKTVQTNIEKIQTNAQKIIDILNRLRNSPKENNIDENASNDPT